MSRVFSVQNILNKRCIEHPFEGIWLDANIIFRIEGFRMFPISRYGGGKAIDINTELANQYFGK